jgi:WD40 repeat protein
MKSVPNSILFTLAAIAGLLTQAKPAQSQPEEQQRGASRWDQATAERFFRKGAWREGIAYLGRSLRLDPQNSAAARHLWSAVVDGVGDRNTLPVLVLRQEAEVHVAVFSPDGRRILTASADKTARLWDATTGAPVGEPMRHEDEVVAAVFSPDGAHIATASKDGTARLWDAATGKALGAPMRHEHPLDGVAFNATGTRIVTQSNEADVARLWDPAAGAPIGEAMPHSVGYGEPATFSAGGNRLVTKRGETARVWDSMSGKPLGKPLKHPGVVSNAAFSPDASRILTLSQDGKARAWSIAAGKIHYTVSMKNSQAIDRADFSPDGTRIVTFAAWSGELWDAATGRRVGSVPASTRSDAEGGASATFSPDSTSALLSCSDSGDDKVVRAWDCKTGEARGIFAWDRSSVLRHPEEVLEVFFTADGMRIVTTCQDGAVRVWDAENGELIGQPLRHDRDANGFLTSVSASPDGARILTLTDKNIVRVWQAAAGEPLEKPLPAGSGEAPPMLTGAGLPPEFIEALCGYRFSDDGALRELPDFECAALRDKLRNSETIAASWRPLIAWWLAPANERALSPGATLTRREYVDREIANVTNDYEKIRNAYLMDPTHPLIHIALAGLEEWKHADFLRAYDIARLPADPAIRARAAEMLIKQRHPELARKVTGIKSAK